MTNRINMKAFILVLCACFATIMAVPSGPRGLTDEMINYINSAQTSWTAGSNFAPDTTLEDVKKLLGTFRSDSSQRPELLIKDAEILTAIPAEFDARLQWPQCPSIGEIRDQGSCGSCWAFGAAEAITDRICIASNAVNTPHISAEDLNSCCTTCGFGCNGGYTGMAWDYWVNTGIVTGGNYNSGEGCLPYSIASCSHHVNGTRPPCASPTPACTAQCISGYPLTYVDDKWRGLSTYGFSQDVAAIQNDVLLNGPLEVDFNVYEDFFSYKSGVYYHITGTYAGGHAVKLLGWGTENSSDYWLIANSWNEEWGDLGYFKILRGVNECGIESNAVAGLPA